MILGIPTSANHTNSNHHLIKRSSHHFHKSDVSCVIYSYPTRHASDNVTCFRVSLSPSSKTLTLTITNKSYWIIPSFTFYFILVHIRSSHHSIPTTFFAPQR